ncbi:hypothetical protein M5F03_16430 [Acinetobacter sp. ANC 5579]|uniref:cell division protein BlhA n=1 Tax=Acinetobacter TaxID=469 RepID=UPI0015D25837|nr:MULTISPECIES: hypothetical protein [Acinetobacter]MCL6232164.1 hypothetical protein [Acinetobacter amyesii]MCL6236709.1 hypothetical protein [Acinetobacter amyesii]MCL6240240.1 hypothetical protein [Acinetobacter amyesii]MCL6244084.1 hypothetical protein [Acinetobacter amyesii]
MALNVGPDFKQRWLKVPEAIRQTFIDDLGRVCDVLNPSTDIQQWLVNDQQQQQVSFDKIESAYADLKAQLIEDARIRKQLALEKALEEKREAEQAYAEQLKRDEELRFAAQTQALTMMQHNLNREVQHYAARYHKNPETGLAGLSQSLSVSEGQMLSELESVRVRLELEAETQIEMAVSDFRAKLKAAAQEEIDYILENSNFSTESTSSQAS